MQQMLIRWFIHTVAVWVATGIFHKGLTYDSWQSLLFVALILGILNSLVKPLLQVLSIPFIIASFGVFLLVINAFLFKMAASLSPGFHVANFWYALGGSLVISLVSMMLGYSGTRNYHSMDPPQTLYSDSRRPPAGRGKIIDV